MTLDDVLNLLAKECERAGSGAKWAAANGVSREWVSAVLARKRPPGPTILAALGLERVTRTTVSYRRVR